MSLKNYKIPRTSVPLGNGETIAVRGLNLEDVSFVVQVHRNDVDQVINLFRNRLKTADPSAMEQAVRDNSGEMLLTFVHHFPLLAANVIAVASDEPEAFDNALKLPLPVQIEALIQISRLTFEDFEGFKKFVGNAIAVAQSVAKKPPQSKKTKATKSTGSTD